MTVVGMVVFLVGAVISAVALVRASARRRDAERARLAASWEALIRERDAVRTSGVHLVQVLNVYQRAQRGSKAVIRWCDTGETQDAWFWGRHIPPGAYLLLRGTAGFGPHNHNPHVLYVQPHDVHRMLPAHAPAAWQAHQGAGKRPNVH